MLVSVFPFVSGGGAGERSQSDVASHGRTPDFPSRAPPRNEEASQVTWQMGDSPLKLSVPMELQVWPECSSTVSTMLWLEAEIAGLLTDARKRGERNLFGDATPAEKIVSRAGRMEEAVLQRLSSTWELMGAEARQTRTCLEEVLFWGRWVFCRGGLGEWKRSRSLPISAPSRAGNLPRPSVYLPGGSTGRREKVQASPSSFRGSRRGEVARRRLYVWVQFPTERLSELFRVASRQSEAPKIFDPESHFSRPLNESAT